MSGRDLLAAYRQDVATAARTLTAAGTRVLLVDAPPRPDQTVGPDGLTDLDRVWRQVQATVPGVEIVRAGLSVTDGGRWISRLPCRPGERCDPDGTVSVRSPDGVHFCPEVQPPMTDCPLYAAGAERYGEAMARGALDPSSRAEDGAACRSSPAPAGSAAGPGGLVTVAAYRMWRWTDEPAARGR
jgi:hypothetical protein